MDKFTELLVFFLFICDFVHESAQVIEGAKGRVRQEQAEVSEFTLLRK